MKFEFTDTTFTLTPDTPEELAALHNARYRGVAGMHLTGLHDKTTPETLVLTLGRDVIAEGRALASLEAKVTQAVLNAGNQLIGVDRGQDDRVPTAAVVYFFDRICPQE